MPDYFMFHGAPDILINKSVHVINTGSVYDYSSLSSDDEYALENLSTETHSQR